MALIYFAQGSGQCLIIGLSTDTKPSSPPDNFCFLELDTAKWYKSSSGAWGSVNNSYYAVASSTTSALNGKQDTLVSGTNIKTVNGNSIVGSGNVSITSSVAWGAITGVLSAQADLAAELALKAPLTSPVLVTPVLGTPTSGNLANCTFPTLNQNTTGTASNVTGIVASSNGGTGINNGGRTLTISTNSGAIDYSGSALTLTVAGNASVSGTNTGDQTISDATITTSDITTNNASASKHGFLPKLDNTGTKYLRDDGTWQSVSGGGYTLVATLAADQATGANTTPVTLTGLVFSYAANSKYRIWFMGLVQPGAATTGCGFQFDLSSAVTAVNVSFYHQLANTGTLTGGHSIADNASVGVSSGMPGTSTYPVTGNGLLITTGNTGTAQLMFRSETTAVTTCKSNFTLVVEKIA